MHDDDDYRRLRQRLSDERLDAPTPSDRGTPAMLAYCYTVPFGGIAGVFHMLYPTTILGDESEGGLATLIVDYYSQVAVLQRSGQLMPGYTAMAAFGHHRWFTSMGSYQPFEILGCNIPATDLLLTVKYAKRGAFHPGPPGFYDYLIGSKAIPLLYDATRPSPGFPAGYAGLDAGSWVSASCIEFADEFYQYLPGLSGWKWAFELACFGNVRYIIAYGWKIAGTSVHPCGDWPAAWPNGIPTIDPAHNSIFFNGSTTANLEAGNPLVATTDPFEMGFDSNLAETTTTPLHLVWDGYLYSGVTPGQDPFFHKMIVTLP